MHLDLKYSVRICDSPLFPTVCRLRFAPEKNLENCKRNVYCYSFGGSRPRDRSSFLLG